MVRTAFPGTTVFLALSRPCVAGRATKKEPLKIMMKKIWGSGDPTHASFPLRARPRFLPGLFRQRAILFLDPGHRDQRASTFFFRGLIFRFAVRPSPICLNRLQNRDSTPREPPSRLQPRALFSPDCVSAKSDPVIEKLGVTLYVCWASGFLNGRLCDLPSVFRKPSVGPLKMAGPA